MSENETIWKYDLGTPTPHLITHRMPDGAHPLSVGVQDGKIVLWARVAPGKNAKDRQFAVAWTGEPLPWAELKPPVVGYNFLGTVTIEGLVCHVFELL